MSNLDLTGVIAATTTPVSATFEIEVERLARHVTRLISQGCRFVSTFGTTGEGASLSPGQICAALDELKALGIDPGRLVPAVMTPSVEQGAQIVKAAARLNCRAVLILPPFFYNDPSDQGVVDFIGEVLRRAGKPDIDVLLYNIPRFSGVPYTGDLIARLIEVFGSQIAGIKDSTGDAANGLSLVQRFPQLRVFTGDDRVMPGLVDAGGAGMIGGMPNLFAPDLVRIWENPTSEETAPLRQRQADRIKIIDSNGSLVAIKAALAVQYGDAEWIRAIPPLRALEPQDAKGVLDDLAQTGYVPG